MANQTAETARPKKAELLKTISIELVKKVEGLEDCCLGQEPPLKVLGEVWEQPTPEKIASDDLKTGWKNLPKYHQKYNCIIPKSVSCCIQVKCWEETANQAAIALRKTQNNHCNDKEFALFGLKVLTIDALIIQGNNKNKLIDFK